MYPNRVPLRAPIRDPRVPIKGLQGYHQGLGLRV